MLENLIQELTKALIANTEALNRLASNTPAAPAAPAAPQAEPTKRGRKAAESAPAAETPAQAAPAPAAPAEPAIDLAALRTLAQQILDLGGLDKIKAINAELGIKKVSECPPEKFGDLSKALSKAKGELEAK